VTGYDASLAYTVTDGDTAVALGSGDVPVLATPRLVAWLEAATCAAASAAGRTDLDRTSVGTRVTVEHLAATPVGGHLEVVATLVGADGRLLRFTVAATDATGRLVASGEITRVVVDRARFLERVPPPA
jgi:predicted thioesterase